VAKREGKQMANDVTKTPEAPTLEQRTAEKITQLEASLVKMQQAVQHFTQKAEEARIQVIAQTGAIQVLRDVLAPDALTMGEFGEMVGGEVEYVKNKDKPQPAAKG